MYADRTYNVVAFAGGEERPVTFTVRESLAFAYDKLQGDQEWDEVELVTTTKGSYVLRRSERTLIVGEEESDVYAIFASREDAIAALDSLDMLDRAVLGQIGALTEKSVPV
jgi:hypothetical protein